MSAALHTSALHSLPLLALFGAASLGSGLIARLIRKGR